MGKVTDIMYSSGGERVRLTCWGHRFIAASMNNTNLECITRIKNIRYEREDLKNIEIRMVVWCLMR
jgi:hypothetical protein